MDKDQTELGKKVGGELKGCPSGCASDPPNGCQRALGVSFSLKKTSARSIGEMLVTKADQLGIYGEG